MKYIICYILLILPWLGYSQSLRVEELAQYRDKSLRMQEKQTELAIKKAEKQQLNSNRIPLIFGDANLQRNLIIPTTPVPAIAFDPQADEGAILPLKFATRWNSKAGIQLSWDLFNPTQQADQASKDIELEKTNLQIQKEEQDWLKEAIKAYAASVLASEQLRLAIADSSNYQQILEISKQRAEAGREKQADYISAQQEMTRKLIQWQEAWAVLQEADIQFRGLLAQEDLQFLSSNIADIQSYVESLQEQDYTVQLLELDRNSALVDLKNLRKKLLPTLTFNAYFGTQFFSNSFNIIESDRWYGNSFANIGLKLPISAYISNRPAYQKSNLQEKLSRIKIQQQQNDWQQQQAIKEKKVFAAKQKIVRLQHILDLAQQLLDQQKAAYTEGRLLLSEYNKANGELIKAKQDLWQAQFDLISLSLAE
ncbi:TolC family protein [Sphingobacterium humi]|uniref:TolC family protein n=1 Tax=Sphingobacterium humi TaxID=1796905 RepID=A0A6N8KXE5_9SPHI|nr:TolC family protein [Sphingobacterium humi]MVZ62115.1 hypothetical protein [Sphingobacterium humi]